MEKKEFHVVIYLFLSWTFSAIVLQNGCGQMQRWNNTSGQQADSNLNTALLSLVYKALVSLKSDTNRPQHIRDSTGAPVATNLQQIHRHYTCSCLKLT